MVRFDPPHDPDGPWRHVSPVSWFALGMLIGFLLGVWTMAIVTRQALAGAVPSVRGYPPDVARMVRGRGGCFDG